MNQNTAVLHTGESVSTTSAAWLHECEARDLLRMPSRAARLDYLYGPIDPKMGIRRGGIAKKRGKPAADRLLATAMAIWQAHQSRK